MELKDICVDLELAEKLKKNGFRQDTLLCHCSNGGFQCDNNKKYFIGETKQFKRHDLDFLYSAPTTDELLNELPDDICYKEKRLFLNIIRTNETCCIKYEYVDMIESLYLVLNNNFNITDKKLPNALAKCWLYLKDNNLLAGVK